MSPGRLTHHIFMTLRKFRTPSGLTYYSKHILTPGVQISAGVLLVEVIQVTRCYYQIIPISRNRHRRPLSHSHLTKESELNMNMAVLTTSTYTQTRIVYVMYPTDRSIKRPAFVRQNT